MRFSARFRLAFSPGRVHIPNEPQRVVDRALARDEASARAEYLAQFRSDVEACLTIEAVDAVTIPNLTERGRISDVRYFAFVDPSGGSSDSMTLAIGHKEGGRAILDVVREVKAPFSPDAVVQSFAAVMKSYGINRVQGDRYGGEFSREPFRKHGIDYRADAKPRTELYRDLIPRVNSGEVELLDNKRLALQLVSLERRTTRGGRDSIDHPPKGHDDVANAVAGVLVQIFDRTFQTAQPGRTSLGFYGGDGFGQRTSVVMLGDRRADAADMQHEKTPEEFAAEQAEQADRQSESQEAVRQLLAARHHQPTRSAS